MDPYSKVALDAAKHTRGSEGFVPTQYVPYPPVSQQYLDEDTPSRRLKISKAVESRRLNACTGFITAAWKEISAGASGAVLVSLSALAYFHRFYAVKDMKNNDRTILSIASLFLATKSEDYQLALNDVIYRFWSRRFKEKNPTEWARIKDPEFFHYIREQVLSAERSLLYALGFSLRISHPNSLIAKLWNQGKDHADPEVSEFWHRTYLDSEWSRHLFGGAWGLANDCARSQAILMFDTRNIAMACTYRALQRARIDPESVPKADGKPFWLWHGAPGIDMSIVERILEVISRLYEKVEELPVQHWRTLPWAQGPWSGRSPAGEGHSPHSVASASTSVAAASLEQGGAAAPAPTPSHLLSPSTALSQVHLGSRHASSSADARGPHDGVPLTEWYTGRRVNAGARAASGAEQSNPASTSGLDHSHEPSLKSELGVKAVPTAKSEAANVSAATAHSAAAPGRSPGQKAMGAVRSHIAHSPYQSPSRLGKRTANGDLVSQQGNVDPLPSDDSPLMWSP